MSIPLTTEDLKPCLNGAKSAHKTTEPLGIIKRTLVPIGIGLVVKHLGYRPEGTGFESRPSRSSMGFSSRISIHGFPIRKVCVLWGLWNCSLLVLSDSGCMGGCVAIGVACGLLWGVVSLLALVVVCYAMLC